jgi:hypothetical protein
MGNHHAVGGGARRLWPGFLLGLLSLSACVDPFRGSSVQIDFNNVMPAVADRGTTPTAGQAPADTFLLLYAADYKFTDADGDGRADLDVNGQPLIDEAYLYEVQRFEVRKLIDMSSPCFIDLPGGAGIEGQTVWSGLHVTQHALKTREVQGVTDPLDPSVPYDKAVIVLTADRRVELLPRLQNELKAVVSTDATVEPGIGDFQYPATAPAGACPPGGPNDIPHPTCTDDQSNAQRLRVCQDLWEQAGPNWYEGSDKVFTLPLNGKLYGFVEGMNPINQVGLIGGASFYVDENLVGHDAYLINYQWKDYNGDGTPDAPAGMESDIGQPYFFARAEHFSRGVTNGTFRHPTISNLQAGLAVFPDLGDDSVQF